MKIDEVQPAAPPEDFAALKAHLTAQSAQLPKRLRQCARFVLDNPHAVALGSTAAVARAAGVQPSTLVRFAQTIGFSGFSDMQVLLKDNLLEQGQGAPTRGRKTQNPDPTSAAAILTMFEANAHSALTAMVAEMDRSRFERAVTALAEASTIHLLGLRRSFPVATYLYYALGKIGKRCNLLDGLGGMLADRTDIIGPSDVLLIVTFHPYAPEVAEFAETVSQAGRTVLAITDTPLSPAEAIAREVLYVRDAELDGYRTLSATMCLASALTLALSKTAGATP